MWGHPPDEKLLDIVEGGASTELRAHAESCARCRERLDDARAALGLAREGAALPEPSPVYWEAFRRRVDREIVAGPAPRAWGWRPALASAAGILALVAVLDPLMRAPETALEPRTLPAWSALPPLSEDTTLLLISELEQTEELVAAESAPLGIAGDVAELSDAEQRRLAQALQALLQDARSGKKS
jgi:hypothetical protein